MAKMMTDHGKAIVVAVDGTDWVVEMDWDDDGYAAKHIYLDQGERGWAEDNGPDLMPMFRDCIADYIAGLADEAQREADRKEAEEAEVERRLDLAGEEAPW